MAELMIRTAGESHGPAILTLVEGFPAAVPVDPDRLAADMARRQGGYGRSPRMQIEADRIEILAGVRHGRTLPGPIVLVVRNHDSRLEGAPEVSRPRPGHADLAGALKYLDPDMRNILERASARETAGRVAAGALAKCLLDEFGIDVLAYVVRIGAAAAEVPDDIRERRRMRDASEVYAADPAADPAMKAAIDAARDAGDSLGGVIECIATGLPPGLGSHIQWTAKLDGRLARAVMSIQAIKAVEIGLGMAVGERPGSEVHDPITYDPKQREAACLGFIRPTNHAGGIEGGMTNGAPVVVRAAMKPIPTLLQGMPSVNIKTKEAEQTAYERSDVCAVPAASVVVEAVVATELAAALVARFGGDTLREMKAAHGAWRKAALEL